MKIPSVEGEQLTTNSGVDYQPTEEDNLFNQLFKKQLVNETFRAWYCTAFYKLGRAKVMEFVGKTEIDGKNKARYFSYLLKRELSRME